MVLVVPDSLAVATLKQDCLTAGLLVRIGYGLLNKFNSDAVQPAVVHGGS